MRRIAFAGIAGIVAVTSTAATLHADEPGPVHKLVGTWKLASAKYGGQEVAFPDGTTTIKHVTPSQFMWLTYNELGAISRTAGGPYTLKGDTYEELPEYGFSPDFETIKGKPQTFTWRVDGNRWFHDGKLSNGLTIEEVWERVIPK
jgi:hypothetical protein